MPIYDYQYKNCGKTYDIFHKVREIAVDVVCPSCGSGEHVRLLSAPTFSMGGQVKESAPSALTCCGGSCGLN
ncbi:MAG: zinc ribbon domain-containing protein [Bacteroidota bacterium]